MSTRPTVGGDAPQRFTPHTRDALVRSGWHPGRRVDLPDEAVRRAAPAGALSDAAERFLREFHGLKLQFDWPSKPGDPHFVYLDLGQTLPVDVNRSERLQSLCGEVAFPIGGSGWLFYFYMTPSGKVVAVDLDWQLFLPIGPTGDAALECVCTGAIRDINAIEISDTSANDDPW